MADSVVAFLLQNLSRLLEDELKLLSGVEDKVNSLCSELRLARVLPFWTGKVLFTRQHFEEDDPSKVLENRWDKHSSFYKRPLESRNIAC
ncbi:Disease resistance protein RPP13 [Spatholobus suberectus]|nr:Disease resistance protein RPP13 [Spatholobus suberectus]